MNGPTTDEMLAMIRDWQQAFYPGRPIKRIRFEFLGSDEVFDIPMPIVLPERGREEPDKGSGK